MTKLFIATSTWYLVSEECSALIIDFPHQLITVVKKM
jgi:hypothetical protein